MDEDLARALRFIALQLVLVTALVHLLYALPRLALYTPEAMAVYADHGIFPPPRPALFLLTGLAIPAGVLATWRGWLPLRAAYTLGLALMVMLIVAWVGWHTVLEHGAVLTDTTTESASPGHHSGVLDTVVDHYVEPLASVVGQASRRPGANTALIGVVAKTIELGAALALWLLLRGDPAADRDWDAVADPS